MHVVEAPRTHFQALLLPRDPTPHVALPPILAADIANDLPTMRLVAPQRRQLLVLFPLRCAEKRAVRAGAYVDPEVAEVELRPGAAVLSGHQRKAVSRPESSHAVRRTDLAVSDEHTARIVRLSLDVERRRNEVADMDTLPRTSRRHGLSEMPRYH